MNPLLFWKHPTKLYIWTFKVKFYEFLIFFFQFSISSLGHFYYSTTFILGHFIWNINEFTILHSLLVLGSILFNT